MAYRLSSSKISLTLRNKTMKRSANLMKRNLKTLRKTKKRTTRKKRKRAPAWQLWLCQSQRDVSTNSENAMELPTSWSTCVSWGLRRIRTKTSLIICWISTEATAMLSLMSWTLTTSSQWVLSILIKCSISLHTSSLIHCSSQMLLTAKSKQFKINSKLLSPAKPTGSIKYSCTSVTPQKSEADSWWAQLTQF